MASIEVLATALGALTTIGGAFIAVFKWLIPHLRQQRRRMAIVDKILAEIGDDAPKVLTTNIKRIELAIDRLTGKMAMLTKHFHLGIYSCDSEGMCNWVNKRLADMFGMETEQMLGYGWCRPIVDAQAAYHNWAFAVRNNTPYHDNYAIRVNGKCYMVHAEAERMKTIDDAATIYYIGVIEVVKEMSEEEVQAFVRHREVVR